MEENNFKTIGLSVISISIALVAIASEEYRLLIVSIFALFLVAYFLYTAYSKIEDNIKSIRKLNEKLKIHKDLINIKADIKNLENKFKK